MKKWMITFVMASMLVACAQEEAVVEEVVQASQQELREQAEQEAEELLDAYLSQETVAEVATTAEEVETIASTFVEKAPEDTIATLGLTKAIVKRVVDGDTIELTDGSKVRLIGVNTPESTTRTEVFGKEASNYTRSVLESKTVYLQKDVSDTDRYGRLLRFVWLEVPTSITDETEIRYKMFNANLLLNGYATPATYPPDVRYAEIFVQFAQEARDHVQGLWQYTEDDADLDKEEAPQEEIVLQETEWYKNCTALREVYPEGVPADHPAYHSKHDRDKDNWACER